MRNFWAIFRKEWTAYFISPIAYVVIILFLLLMGFFFTYFLSIYTWEYSQYQAQLNYYFQLSAQYPMLAQQGMPQPPDFNSTVTQPFYFWLSFIMLFILPMLTMRLFSEEKRAGTIELLLTYPVSDAQIILGKFFAAWAVFAVIILLTLFFPLFINFTTEKAPLETGPLVLTYGGAFLVGGAFIAIGLLISTLTRNQIVAAVITFGVLFGFFFLWLLGFSADFLSEFIGLFKVKEFVDFFRHLSIFGHNENFIMGLFDTRDLVYCIDLTLAGLILCWFSLGARKWRA